MWLQAMHSTGLAKDIGDGIVDIFRGENDGKRVSKDAVQSLLSGG